MKYMIVEDDFSGIRLLAATLKLETGCEVHLSNLHDATALNREHMPEIVHFDGLDGECFKLYDELKRDNPDANYLIYSANTNLLSQARDRGIPFFQYGEIIKLVGHVKDVQSARNTGI